MKKGTKISLATVAGIVIVGAAVGLSMYFKPHKDFAGSTPDFRMTVSELVGAFLTDEAAATVQFVSDDKTVMVSGTVRETDTDSAGNAVIVLEQAGAEGSVSCTLTPAASTEAVTIVPGDPVRIQGQCTGMQGLIEPQVILIRCAVSTH